MKRALAFGFAALVASASCAGKGAKGSTLTGNVHETGGNPIPGASITIEGNGANSNAAGAFTLDASSGTRTVTVEAAGYYTISPRIPLAPGENRADFALVSCDPADTTTPSCIGTPTPTPTATATPPPDANVFLTFDGLNYPGSAQPIPAHNGQAQNATTGTVWGDGGNGGQNYGFTECYADAAEQQPLGPGNTAADINHCIVDYYQTGAATQAGFQDAMVELKVDGALWALAAPDIAAPVTARCSVAEGTCSLRYYEVIPASQTFQGFFTATDGVADVVIGGYKNPQSVQIDNGAFTALDFP